MTILDMAEKHLKTKKVVRCRRWAWEGRKSTIGCVTLFRTIRSTFPLTAEDLTADDWYEIF